VGRVLIAAWVCHAVTDFRRGVTGLPTSPAAGGRGRPTGLPARV
jgi:hypothetical protein